MTSKLADASKTHKRTSFAEIGFKHPNFYHKGGLFFTGHDSAKFRLDQLHDPRPEAEQLAGAKQPFHLGLAELWLLIGDTERAKLHALAAYKWAWADGEP